MALEDILNKIDAEAEARAKKVLDKAEIEKQKRLDAWMSKAESDVREISSRAEEEADRIVRQAGAEGRLEANKAMLRLKRKWLARVTDAAREKLITKDTNLHRKILEAMVTGYIDDETTAVTFSGDPEGRKMAGATEKSHGIKVNISKQGEEPRGGIIVQKGPVTMNLSFSVLFEEVSSRVQASVYAILSGENHG